MVLEKVDMQKQKKRNFDPNLTLDTKINSKWATLGSGLTQVYVGKCHS